MSKMGDYSDGSPGGSNWTIAVMAGKSSPRAATSVQSSTPAWQRENSRKAVVRSLCARQIRSAVTDRLIAIRYCTANTAVLGTCLTGLCSQQVRSEML